MKNELRAKFLKGVREVVDYWDFGCATEIRQRERLEGVVFSILTILDGEHGSLPPYAVRPIFEAGKEGEDIGGILHVLFSGEES